MVVASASARVLATINFHGLKPLGYGNLAIIGDLARTQCDASHLQEDSAGAEEWRGGGTAGINPSAPHSRFWLDRNAMTSASAVAAKCSQRCASSSVARAP